MIFFKGKKDKTILHDFMDGYVLENKLASFNKGK